MGILSTGILDCLDSTVVNDAVSIKYIFKHYYDVLPIVQVLIQQNTIPSLICDCTITWIWLLIATARAEHCSSLIEPVIQCINAFYSNTPIIRTFVTIFAILCRDQRTY